MEALGRAPIMVLVSCPFLNTISVGMLAMPKRPASAGSSSTFTLPTFTMPAFGWRLTDSQVAELSTFVRRAWGNQAPAVTAAQVAKVRKPLGPEAQAIAQQKANP